MTDDVDKDLLTLISEAEGSCLVWNSARLESRRGSSPFYTYLNPPPPLPPPNSEITADKRPVADPIIIQITRFESIRTQTQLSKYSHLLKIEI